MLLKSKKQLRDTSNDQIIRPRNLPQETGLSRTTIFRLERAGQFPKKIRLSPGAVGYRRADVEQWLADRHAVSRED